MSSRKPERRIARPTGSNQSSGGGIPQPVQRESSKLRKSKNSEGNKLGDAATPDGGSSAVNSPSTEAPKLPVKRTRPKRSGIPEATISPDKFPRPPPRHSRIARSSQFLNPSSPDKFPGPSSNASATPGSPNSSTWPRQHKNRTPSLISPETFPTSTIRSPRIPRATRSHHDTGAMSSPETSSPNIRILMEEMRQHILHLKQELDREKVSHKQLKREKTLEIKSTKETEQQRAVLTINELKSRYHQEKQKEMAALKEQMLKRHEEEILKLQRQQEEQMNKSQGELQKELGSVIQRTKQQALHDAKGDAKKVYDSEKARLQQEIDELKGARRKLEDELHTITKSDRTKANDLKRLVNEHQRAIEKIRKDARRDIVRLLDEVRAKERLLTDLGKELGSHSSHAQRLQIEKDSLDQLLKLAESWEKKPSSQSSSKGSTGSPVTESLDFGIPEGLDGSERDKLMQQKMLEMSALIKKLEEINKSLTKDKEHVDKKLKMFLSIKGMAPLVEKNKQLTKKVKSLESGKKKVEDRNRLLGEDNTRLRSLKDEMRSRLDQDGSQTRRGRPKHRSSKNKDKKDKSKDKSKDKNKDKNKDNEENGKEKSENSSKEKKSKDDEKASENGKEMEKKDKEELIRLRKENEEQFHEIVELKQTALILELKQSAMEIARKQRGEASSSNPSPRDTPSDRRARSLSAQRRHMRTPTSGFSESEEDSQRSHSSSGIPVPMRSRSTNGRHSFQGSSYKTPLQGKDMGPWSEDNQSLKSNGESGHSPSRRRHHRRSHSDHRRLLAKVNCNDDVSNRSKSTGASIDVSWAGSWASSAVLSDSDDLGWEEFDKAALEANLSQVTKDYRDLKKNYEHLLSLIEAAANGQKKKDKSLDTATQNGQGILSMDFDKFRSYPHKDAFHTAVKQIKTLQQQLKDLQDNKSRLKLALEDAREQNELLEFRTLELEEEDDSKPREVPMVMQTAEQEAHFNDLKEKMADLRESKAGMLLTQNEIELLLQAIQVLDTAREKIRKFEIQAAGLRNQIQLVESEREIVSIEKRKLDMRLAVQSSGLQRSEPSAITDETMQLTPTAQDIDLVPSTNETTRQRDESDTMQLLTPVSMLLSNTGGRKKAWEKGEGGEDGDGTTSSDSEKRKLLRDQNESKRYRFARKRDTAKSGASGGREES